MCPFNATNAPTTSAAALASRSTKWGVSSSESFFQLGGRGRFHGVLEGLEGRALASRVVVKPDGPPVVLREAPAESQLESLGAEVASLEGGGPLLAAVLRRAIDERVPARLEVEVSAAIWP